MSITVERRVTSGVSRVKVERAGSQVERAVSTSGAASQVERAESTMERAESTSGASSPTFFAMYAPPRQAELGYIDGSIEYIANT